MLASLVAVGQLVVGSESFAVVGSPGGGDRALAGEDFEVGLVNCWARWKRAACFLFWLTGSCFSGFGGAG